MAVEHVAGEGVVLVPVPVPYLPAVYKLLGSVMETQVDGAVDEESVLVDEHQGSWTKSMILRLHAGLHLEGVRTMLDAVAKAAPGEVSMQAGAELWGKSNKHLGAQMGALTKLTKTLFGKATWPMHIRYNDQGQAYYSMPTRIAGWWLGVDA